MRRVAVLMVVAVLAMGLSACEYPFFVTDPGEGEIVEGSTVTVTGTVAPFTKPGGVLHVDDVQVPYDPVTGAWTTEVGVDTGALVDVIEVRYFDGNTEFVHERAVVAGPAVDEGELSPDGVGMHFTNAGLASLGPVVEGLASSGFDIGGALAGQGNIVDTSFAILPGINVGVTGDVFEAGSGDVGLTTQSTTSGMRTNIALSDLYVGLDLDIQTFGNCKLELDIPTTTIVGDFDLEPAPGDPSAVDVNLLGQPSITTTGLTWEFISGVCDPDSFLIGGLVSSIAGGAVEDAVADAFRSTLGDPDGAGPADSVIADAIETALAGLDISGSVGAALGVNLEAPIQALTEAATGLTLRSDADFFATLGAGPNDCPAVANAPDITNTYDNPSSFPAFGSTAPNGQPYGLGLVISSSAFNQLLGALAECGAFNAELSSLALGGGAPLPLTAGLLTLFDPAFGVFEPTRPFKLEISPSGAPFVTDEPGPNGEMATLMIPSIEVSFVDQTPATPLEIMRVNLDARLGLDLAFDPVGNQLVPTITAGPPGSVTARVTANGIGADSPAIEALFTALFPMFVADLTASFSAFPLPSFLGLQLSVVQVVRSGNNWLIYSNLTPTPTTQLANVVLTNTSDGAFENDDVITDSSQWRHSVRKTQSSTVIGTHFRASMGADSATFLDDESVDRTGRYRLAFDVVPAPGESWQIDVGHTFAGAMTIQGEDNGSARSEVRAPSGYNGNHIVGRYRLNGGAWVYFGFNVAPTVLSSGGTANAGVAGSGGTTFSGSAATSVEIEFAERFYVLSDAYYNWPWDNGAGDEAAFRAGLNDTLTNNFTAGEYPGQGNRVAGNDGHKAMVVLTPLP